MAIRLGERVKTSLLATVLAFMVGSYFVSDTSTRDHSTGRGVHPKQIAKVVCASRTNGERATCNASVAEALVPTNAACMAQCRNFFACTGEKKGEKICQEEAERYLECLQVHLEPQLLRRGFTRKEIAQLHLGSQGRTKQHPTPTGGEGDGQGGEGEGTEGDAAGGKKSDIVPEAGGDEGGAGPEVEVVEGPKDGDGDAWAGPKVEVVEGPKDGDGDARAGPEVEVVEGPKDGDGNVL